MTIDERLEALAQSVELLSTLHQDTERAAKAFEQRVDRFVEFAQLVLSNHEQRIRGIEQK